MDESWRILNGLNLPRRKSTDFSSARPRPGQDLLDPDEFRDVFGGPPRSVFLRKFSGDFSPSSFYDEIFRPEEFDQPSRTGRTLPVFRIPEPARGSGAGSGNQRRGAFYEDIFRSEEHLRRSRSRSETMSKSRSNCSSVLSSEDLSPLRPSAADDAGFSSFASKLRPVNIPCRQSSALAGEQRRQGTSGVPCPHPSFMEFQFKEADPNELFTKSNLNFSQPMPSPESINAQPSSYRSVKISLDDFEVDSSASEISSVDQQDPGVNTRVQERCMQEQEEHEDYFGEEEEEADFLSSYVIEIGSDRREETDEAAAVDEAIAWVKEKSRYHNAEDQEKRPGSKSPTERREYNETEVLLAQVSEELKKWETDRGHQLPKKDMTMELLEEDIRLWSVGKEGDIRSILSTLQYILWPDSGWRPLSLSDMMESSQVRKAYQRARLCLHPDKLQQKGATTPQKFTAEKIFNLLQEAWTEFNSRDVFGR